MVAVQDMVEVNWGAMWVAEEGNMERVKSAERKNDDIQNHRFGCTGDYKCHHDTRQNKTFF